MFILASTSDKLQLVTSAAATLEVHASWVDNASGTITPGRTNTEITTATTTDVVASPASSTQRNIKTLLVRNAHASTATDVTVRHNDGTVVVDVFKCSLPAGYMLQYDDDGGFAVTDNTGRRIQNSTNTQPAVVNTLNVAVLGADVTNNNATANTIADVTGLSFAVNAGETYWFRFVIDYTAAATTTGSRWSVSGPGSPTRLSFTSYYSLTSTTKTTNQGLSAYDTPAASNATSAATGANQAVVEGFITPSSNGTLIARFASEVSSSAIVAKAGSRVEWMRVL